MDGLERKKIIPLHIVGTLKQNNQDQPISEKHQDEHSSEEMCPFS